jgi:hypothetical protein
VNEILSAAAQSAAEEVAFDQKRVLNRLEVLSRKAEELGQISAPARCEELIGKQRGMFVDRSAHTFQWSGLVENLSDEQLETLHVQFLAIAATAKQKQLAEAQTIDATAAEVNDIAVLPSPPS